MADAFRPIRLVDVELTAASPRLDLFAITEPLTSHVFALAAVI